MCAIGAVAASPSAQAQAPTCSGGLGVVVSEDALASLQSLRRSTFAHAFLVDLVARGDSAHSHVRLAQRAVGAVPPVEVIAELEGGRLSAGALLDCLAAERRRVDSVYAAVADLADLSALVTEVTAGISDDARAAAEHLVAPERRRRLDALVAQLATTLPAGNPIRQRVDALDQAARQAEAWTRACTARRVTLDRDVQALRQQIAAADAAVTPDAPNDGEEGPAPVVDVDGLRATLDNLQAQRAAVCTQTEPDFSRPPIELAARIQDIWQRSGEDVVENARIAGSVTRRSAAASRAVVGAPPVTALASAESLPSLVAGNAALPLAASFPTELVVAVTDFAIERMRDDLVLTYLSRVPAQFDDRPWLRDLFPATLGLTRGLSPGRAYDLSLPTWRAAIVADMYQLPVNALRSEPLLAYLEIGAEGRVAVGRVRAGLSVADALRSGERPLDVLADLPDRFEQELDATDASRSLLLAGARLTRSVAHDLRLQDVDVRADSLPPYILSERTLRQASAGQRQVYSLLLVGDVAMPDADAEAVLEATSRAVGRTADLLAGVAALSQPDSSASRRAIAAADAVGLTLGVPLSLAGALDGGHRPSLDATRQRWATLARLLATLDAGDASGALASSLSFFADVTGQSFPSDGSVLALVTLGAELAEARDRAGMVAAFRATALPPGGYRARREGRGARVAINLYPGVVGGAEWLTDGGPAAATAGLSLPVGLNVHLGGPVSLFVSGLDLGAFLSYRLSGLTRGDGTTVEDAPDVTFRELLSPGLALTVGLGTSPLALVLNGQLMPSLRNVTGSDGERPDATAYRLSLGLAFDLPLFNLSGARDPS